MVRYAVITCFLLSVSAMAMAQQPRELCLNAKDGVEETDCMSQELVKTNLALTRYLQAAQTQVDKQNAGRPKLSASQDMWLKYLAAQCADVYAYREAGTYRNRAELECEIEATRARIHEIWSAYLSTGGSAILAEPHFEQVRVTSHR